MLTEFIDKKLKTAKYKILKDSSYFGEIPGLRGVWASAKTLEGCRKELQEALEDWILLKIGSGEDVSGLKVKTGHRQLVNNA